MRYFSTIRFLLFGLAIPFLIVGCGGGPEPTLSTDAPRAVINSPASGSKTAGTIVFSVQPFDASEVATVHFSVAGNEVEVDTTAEDGFRIFLDTRDYPDGELELSAVTTGENGKATTEIITVENFNSPPSTATVDADGAVLGTLEENGALSTLVVPAGINEGATVNFTARTREQVKADTGIDYDALGVTFLGAQQIDSDQALQQTLMVSSGGFGPQVQPGQAVVNYSIGPDTDGDGIGELVVVNTASVAPNGDVVSDPIAQIQVGSTAKVLSATGSGAKVLVQTTNNLSAEPGMMIELEITGMNIFSPFGNQAFFYSPAANSFAINLASVYPHPSDPDIKIVRTVVPNLPAGPAKLALVNVGSGQVSELFDLSIEPLHALRGSSARAVYTAYIDRMKSTLTSLSEAQRSEVIASLDEAQLAVDQLYDFVEARSNPIELLSVLEIGARMLENTPNEVGLAAAQKGDGCNFPTSSAVHFGLGLGGLIGGALFPPVGAAFAVADMAFTIYEMVDARHATVSGVGGAGADLAQSTTSLVEFVASTDGVTDLVPIERFGFALGSAALAFNAVSFGNALAEYANCELAEASGGGSGNITGMGSLLPSGGSAAGIVVSLLADAVDAGILKSTSTVALKEGTPGGQFAVKILVGGAPRPFTGVTDASGYFFIPMVPEGQDFLAIATNTQTGEQRTVEGVGPPISESAYLPFDFSAPDTGGPTPISLNQVITGTIETENETDFYSFTATAGQEVFFNIENGGSLRFEVFDSDGTRVFNNFFGNLLVDRRRPVLTKGGVYTIAVSAFGQTGRQYSFAVNDVIRQTFEISINDTVTTGVPGPGAGEIESIGDIDAYTFTADPGQEVFFNIENGTSLLRFEVFDSDGTRVFNNFFGVGAARRQVLTKGGVYTIAVSVGLIGQTSWQYSFAVNDVIRQTFEISINDTVTTGVPGPGAGEIESIGDIDVYTFTADPGQEVFFDVQGFDADLGFADFVVTDSDGMIILRSVIWVTDPGALLLTKGGTYTVTVRHSDASTGQYSFQIRAGTQ